jgi:hypothetical protein
MDRREFIIGSIATLSTAAILKSNKSYAFEFIKPFSNINGSYQNIPDIPDNLFGISFPYSKTVGGGVNVGIKLNGTPESQQYIVYWDEKGKGGAFEVTLDKNGEAIGMLEDIFDREGKSLPQRGR